MLMLIRQLTSVIALPITVTIAIPIWLACRNDVTFVWPANGPSLTLVVVGVLVGVVGLVLFAACVFYFWTRGRGTLAPWDPPRHFVADGPYRFVRNPMISGVIFILVGEACIVRSRPLAEWAALFVVINLIYIPLIEEPMLVARFGETYMRYRQAVPRMLPRLRPWSPDRPR
jgi:protein-S-isoprenylcysteine O-methyltransferase Ste14